MFGTGRDQRSGKTGNTRNVVFIVLYQLLTIKSVVENSRNGPFDDVTSLSCITLATIRFVYAPPEAGSEIRVVLEK